MSNPPSPSWCDQAVVDVDPVAPPPPTTPAAPPPGFAKRTAAAAAPAALGSASRARKVRANMVIPAAPIRMISDTLRAT